MTKYSKYVLILLTISALGLGAFLVYGILIKKTPATAPSSSQSATTSAQDKPVSGSFNFKGTLTDIGQSLSGNVTVDLGKGHSQSFPLSDQTKLLEGPNESAAKPTSIDKFVAGSLVIIIASYDANTSKWTTQSLQLITSPS